MSKHTISRVAPLTVTVTLVLQSFCVSDIFAAATKWNEKWLVDGNSVSVDNIQISGRKPTSNPPNFEVPENVYKFSMNSHDESAVSASTSGQDVRLIFNSEKSVFSINLAASREKNWYESGFSAFQASQSNIYLNTIDGDNSYDSGKSFSLIISNAKYGFLARKKGTIVARNPQGDLFVDGDSVNRAVVVNGSGLIDLVFDNIRLEAGSESLYSSENKANEGKTKGWYSSAVCIVNSGAITLKANNEATFTALNEAGNGRTLSSSAEDGEALLSVEAGKITVDGYWQAVLSEAALSKDGTSAKSLVQISQNGSDGYALFSSHKNTSRPVISSTADKSGAESTVNIKADGELRIALFNSNGNLARSGDAVVAKSENGGISKVNLDTANLIVEGGENAFRATGSDAFIRVNNTDRLATTQITGDLTAQAGGQISVGLNSGNSLLTGGVAQDASSHVLIQASNGARWVVQNSEAEAGANHLASFVSNGSSFIDLTNSKAPDVLNIGSLKGNGVVFVYKPKTNKNGISSVPLVDIDRAEGEHSILIQSAGSLQASGIDGMNFLISDGGSFSLLNNGGVIDLGNFLYDIKGKKNSDGKVVYSLVNTGRISSATDIVTSVVNSSMIFQTQLSTLRNRLGEIRGGASEGLWTQLIYSRDSVRGLASTKSKRTTFGMMLGLDHSVRVNENQRFLIGGAFKFMHDRLKNVSSSGKAKDDVQGGLLYLTWQQDTGSYADLVFDFDRYHQKMTSSLTDGTGVKGDYTMWGVGASVEVGHQFRFAEDQVASGWRGNWFIEPQLQLSYYHVPEKEYALSNGMNVTQSSQNSVLSRVGVVLGKSFVFNSRKSNSERAADLYLSAGVKHEFSGSRHVRVNNLSFDHDFGRTTGYVGLGADWKVSRDSHLFAHIEHERGDGYRKDLDVRVGAQVSTEKLFAGTSGSQKRIQTQDSGFRFYGVVDAGIYINHTSNSVTVTDITSGVTKGSRWGIQGKEDLGNGYNISFVLEQGFELDNGVAKSEEHQFYRDSYLGLGTPVGEFDLGRTGALASGNGGGIVGGLSPFGITWKEAGMAKVFVGNIAARLNNMVRYESRPIGDLKFYAQYSNGVDDDAVVSSQKNRYLAVGTTYQKGSLKLIAVADNYFFNDSADKTEAGVAAGKGLKNMRTYNIGGSYDVNRNVRLYLGWQVGQNVKTPRQGDSELLSAARSKNTSTAEGYNTQAVTFGTNINAWGGELKTVLGYAHAERDYESSKAHVYQAGIGYKYPLSKSTYAYAGAAFIHAKSQAKKDGSFSVDRVNTRVFFSGLCHSF